MKTEFLDRLSIKAQISNFAKIRPLEAEFFHVDRQTDGQMDGHEEVNKNSFPKFCQRGLKMDQRP
jgi:hypothetical protein